MAVTAAGWVVLVTRRLRRFQISTTSETPPNVNLVSGVRNCFKNWLIGARRDGPGRSRVCRTRHGVGRIRDLAVNDSRKKVGRKDNRKREFHDCPHLFQLPVNISTMHRRRPNNPIPGARAGQGLRPADIICPVFNLQKTVLADATIIKVQSHAVDEAAESGHAKNNGAVDGHYP